jgi:hypothetical protein
MAILLGFSAGIECQSRYHEPTPFAKRFADWQAEVRQPARVGHLAQTENAAVVYNLSIRKGMALQLRQVLIPGQPQLLHAVQVKGIVQEDVADQDLEAVLLVFRMNGGLFP